MADDQPERLYGSIVIQETPEGPQVIGIPIEPQEPKNN